MKRECTHILKIHIYFQDDLIFTNLSLYKFIENNIYHIELFACNHISTIDTQSTRIAIKSCH